MVESRVSAEQGALKVARSGTLDATHSSHWYGSVGGSRGLRRITVLERPVHFRNRVVIVFPMCYYCFFKYTTMSLINGCIITSTASTFPTSVNVIGVQYNLLFS